MNPNGVEIVRVYTRETGGQIADITPHVPPTGGSFQVVVEAEAGLVEAFNGSSYRIAIEAFDFSAGNNPGLGANATGLFNGAGNQWPNHTEVFTIPVPAAKAAALQDHILRYVAYLVTPNPGLPQIISFAESPLFILSGE